jgi:MHS family proline/betaine transporter-like MFS transporter
MYSAAKRNIVAGSMIGNVLEWYDFAIYGNFAASIGRDFFPREDAVAQLIAAFGVFAVGYLVRPIVGAVIGYIGNYYSRRAARLRYGHGGAGCPDRTSSGPPTTILLC